MSFEAMGKPISFQRKENAYQELKCMGFNSSNERMSIINSVAELLERDKPFEAQKAAMQFLDLTGMYRLFAVLLSGE